jgi:hypothetical protein
MNESIRTLVFVAVAAVVALGAYATRPTDDTRIIGDPPPGGPLFPDFKDPLVAKSLEIRQFDEATARAETFAVAQQPNGQWVIPSHGGYPADAAAQLKKVAETLADLKIIGVIPEKTDDPKGEQARFGVLDPEKAQVGTSGVGTLITIEDAKGNDLVRLIVGKEVAGSTNQRFVRKPNEDRVYVTSIDMSNLPMDFEKWIETNLLKLSTFDVSKVILKDYLLLPTQSGALTPFHRMDAKLSYNSAKGADAWSLDEMKLYSEGGRQAKDSTLGEMEELNKTKLDELRNALGDLKIVDVTGKPSGLGNSLQVNADKIPRDQWRQMAEYGFYPHPTADGKLDIYGKNGEVLIDTKDGVEYVLRFGEIAPQAAIGSTAKKSNKGKSGADKSAADEEQVKVHRYLFVTTQLAPSVLTPPQLEAIPAGPEPAAEEKKPAEGDKKEEQAKKADEPKADADKPDAEKPAVVDPQQAERERTKKENERKMNAYHDQRKKAEVKVGELNQRFADWYYVVSEDVYKKIRLVRSDIVTEASSAKTEGFGIDAFRKLEDEGVKGAAKPATPAMPRLP